MRKPPEGPPETLTHRPLDQIKQIREYQLITPLYGGGVTPGEADPVTIIRATEIRGHLRFWWRATRGGNPAFKADRLKMKLAENALWGAATGTDKSETRPLPTAIQIEVEVLKRGGEEKPFLLRKKINRQGEHNLETFFDRPNIDFHPYVAFPLNLERKDLDKGKAFLQNTFPREWQRLNDEEIVPPYLEQSLKQEGIELHTVRKDVSFRLTITFPASSREISLAGKDQQPEQNPETVSLDVRQEVEAALWAWETFGGIGARTRRGFGALQLLEVNQDLPLSNESSSDEARQNFLLSNRNNDVENWIKSNLKEHVILGTWPNDVPHLDQSLAFIKVAFPTTRPSSSWEGLIKRYAGFRQSRKKGLAGRSNWPEAEAIRDITGVRKYKSLNHPEKFPRAAFGLPILFHFKDRTDPDDTTLQGAEKENERLASPLILRPLACKSGSAIGLAALLKGSRLPPLVLKEIPWNKHRQAQLSKGDLARLPDLDYQTLKGETDILQRFLNYLGGK